MTAKKTARKYAVGDRLYAVDFEYDENNYSDITVYEYVVRSVRRNRLSTGEAMTDRTKLPIIVTAVRKCEETWGKKSEERGDTGWRNNIHEKHKLRFPITSTHRRYRNTLRDALIMAIKQAKLSRERWDCSLENWEKTAYDKLVRQLEDMLLLEKHNLVLVPIKLTPVRTRKIKDKVKRMITKEST